MCSYFIASGWLYPILKKFDSSRNCYDSRDLRQIALNNFTRRFLIDSFLQA